MRMATPRLSQSYDRGTTDVPLIEQTIGDFFDAMPARQPERDALVSAHQKRRYSYASLAAESARPASALLKSGLAPGERVGLPWNHNAERVRMQLATAKAGRSLV